MSAAMIVVEGVKKSQGVRPILHDLNFAVREGESAGLLGPNGSGKTTTIRLLNGVILPRPGSPLADRAGSEPESALRKPDPLKGLLP